MARRKITLEELLRAKQKEPYEDQAAFILARVGEKSLIPIPRSGTTGKKPALCLRYWEVLPETDRQDLREELLYQTVPGIRVDYYLSHLEVYEKERADVRRLDAWLREQKNQAPLPISVNERSFAIFGREKFLSQGGGKTLLAHCGIDPDLLHMIRTAEPFAAYAGDRTVPQNALILENKDPFCGMRTHLLQGHRNILGVPVGTLLYGAGKRVVASFQDFDISAEPYLKDPRNQLLYFGDLDWEGILIYETLAKSFQEAADRLIRPFVPTYLAMLKKAAVVPSLPETKEGQMRRESGLFFSFFQEEDRAKMTDILNAGRYIPQEILNGSDYLHEI